MLGTLGIGAAVTRRPLPHHRAYGSVHGGSTEMVRADKLGEPYILNNPSGGAERYDAAALGVYAELLPGRENADEQ